MFYTASQFFGIWVVGGSVYRCFDCKCGTHMHIIQICWCISTQLWVSHEHETWNETNVKRRTWSIFGTLSISYLCTIPCFLQFCLKLTMLGNCNDNTEPVWQQTEVNRQRRVNMTSFYLLAGYIFSLTKNLCCEWSSFLLLIFPVKIPKNLKSGYSVKCYCVLKGLNTVASTPCTLSLFSSSLRHQSTHSLRDVCVCVCAYSHVCTVCLCLLYPYMSPICTFICISSVGKSNWCFRVFLIIIIILLVGLLPCAWHTHTQQQADEGPQWSQVKHRTELTWVKCLSGGLPVRSSFPHASQGWHSETAQWRAWNCVLHSYFFSNLGTIHK